jgi:hypothetical protein
MAMRSLKIIHADEKRHKCRKCGAVRYESFMEKVDRSESDASSQFGNSEKQWQCDECFKK